MRTILILAAIVLFAFAVRAFDLNGQSFFVDEFSEVALAKKSVAEIIFAADSAPPLFPLTLKAWTTIWQTDAAARWFSVLCGVASVICVWGVGRRLVDDRTGIAAAFVTAILPMHVFYSQFVRNYSLMFLLVALDLWLLLRAAQTNRRRDWAAFTIVAILGAYTHYYFVIFLATSAIIAWSTNPRLRLSANPYAAYSAIALAMLPLAWLLPADLAFQKGLRDARPLNAATIGYTYFSLFNGYTLGPSNVELQTMTASQAIRGAAPWLAAVAAVLIILGYEGWRRLASGRATSLVVTLAALPVLILIALSVIGGLNYNVRFVTWIMIAAAVWLGAGIAAAWNRRHVQIALAAFVLLSAAAYYNRHWVNRYEHEDLRGAASYLQAHASPHDTIYIVSDYMADLMRYYLGDQWHVVELPKPGIVNQVVREPLDAQAAIAQATHESPVAQRNWLIYSRPFHGDPHGLLLEQIAARQSLSLATTVPGVTIYHTDHTTQRNIAAK